MTKNQWLLLTGAVVLVLAALYLWQHWQATPVRATRVIEAPLEQSVVAAGRVVTPTRALVGSEITGTVAQRHVKEGDRVKRGDVLVTLHSEELAARLAEAKAALDDLQSNQRPQALATLTQSEAELQQAAREAQRRRELLKSNSIATELYEKAVQAETVAKSRAEQARLAALALAPGASLERMAQERLRAAQAAFDKTQIRSQFDGLVLSRNVEPGDLVQPGKVLLEVARDGDIEILVPIDERNLGLLDVGKNAVVIADAFPDRPIPATVKSIAPAIDPQKGTVDVRLSIKQLPPFLREDMTVTATIIAENLPQALLVPNSALRTHHATNQSTVLTVDNGTAASRNVKVGIRGITHSQILEGLKAGDLVITSQSVTPGQQLKITHVD